MDRKQISIHEDSIKEIGTHTAEIKLHEEVVVEIEFEVVAELAYFCIHNTQNGKRVSRWKPFLFEYNFSDVSQIISFN